MRAERAFAVDGAFWRRMAHLGASRGPDWFRRYAPPVIGLAFAAALPNARRTVASNLRMIRGEAGAFRDAIDIARTFVTYAGSLAETLAGEAVGPPTTTIRGQEHMHAAIKEKRGGVFVTAHTGGWEIAGPLLTRDHDVPVVMVMEPERVAEAREIHDAARSRRGLKIAHLGDPLASLPLLRHVRGGGVVALQIDRAPPTVRTRPVRLFGQPSTMPEGPLRLAQLSGAPLLPIFVSRSGYRAYEIEAFEAIHVTRRASDAELDAAAQQMADSLERFLTAHPTQWFRFAE